MFQVKKHHIIVTGSVLALILLILAVGGFLTIVAIAHHYELKTGSSNAPAGSTPPGDTAQANDQVTASNSGPPGDKAQMNDQVTIKKTAGIIGPSLSDNMVSYNPQAGHKTFTNMKDALAWAHSTPGMHGIVNVIAKHKDGTVFANYVSTNTRTVWGILNTLNLVLNGETPVIIQTNGSAKNNTLLFGQGGGAVSTHFNGFRYIALINGSGTVTLNGSENLNANSVNDTMGCTSCRASLKDGLLIRSIAVSNEGYPLNATFAGTSTYNQITLTSPAFTFSGTTGMTVRGVMLVNQTSYKASIWAENQFTGVPLGATDTLTITWTITLT